MFQKLRTWLVMLCFAVVILLIYDLNELFIHNVQGYFTGAWVATLFSLCMGKINR